MPPRAKKNVIKVATRAPPQIRRSTRQSVRQDGSGTGSNDIPSIYQDMLNEAAADESIEASWHFSSHRASKRRKLSVVETATVDELFESPTPPAYELPDEQTQAHIHTDDRPQQIVYDDFEGSEDSDVEFEDVELDVAASTTTANDEESSKVEQTEQLPHGPLQINLDRPAITPSKRNQQQQRRTISKAERLLRLDVHKWHLLSLLSHGLQRNAWCNEQSVHALLKPLVPRKLIKLLHTDESKPMYERNHAFNKGVEEVCELWRHQWKITCRGLRRAYWREGVDASAHVDESEDLDLEDFTHAAHTCRGSRDLGAQLFTTLLRSIAVEARLVFSLQVLPFSGGAKIDSINTSKSGPEYVRAPSQNYGTVANVDSPFAPPRRRPAKEKKIVDSPYPVFWTEILTPSQTWIPIDPVVRNSIGKPKTQFEPPLADGLNSMTYVIAYEDDNSARDVTHRYTQWYNAKTRKCRVESTKSGEQWYVSAMNVLRKRYQEPRDEAEADELARRLNSEGMPNSVQDFKGHPVYILERHLRANEVLEPKREVGRVNVGTAKSGKLESVYRRQDVHLCRTADAWYRRGRDVKVGEQPLKRVIPKSKRGLNRSTRAAFSDGEDDDDGDGEEAGVGLYAENQTDVYKPPPVVNGRIPKNAYGNLDVYVPSMIPGGAVHISHPMAARAAKSLGVDFTDAVTGFEFKGRQGTAIVNGIVVAEQFTAATAAVIQGLESAGSEEVQQARSLILLGIWKRMLQALRVRQRVEAEYGNTGSAALLDAEVGDGNDQESEGSEYSDASMDDEGDESDEREIGKSGGFMPEDQVTKEKEEEQAFNFQVFKSKMPIVLPDEVVSQPIVVTRSPHEAPKPATKRELKKEETYNSLFDDVDEDMGVSEGCGGFVVDDDEGDDHNRSRSRNNHHNHNSCDDMYDDGGGFVSEATAELDGDEGGGGFIPEEPTNFNYEDGGGGFIPEPDINGTNLVTHPNSTRDATSAPEADEEDEGEEDTALQLAVAESLITTRDHPSGAETIMPEVDITSENTNEIDGDDTTVADKGVSEVATAAAAAAAVATTPTTTSPSSNPDSLLSHDPNEDDEDPDWLNEALD